MVQVITCRPKLVALLDRSVQDSLRPALHSAGATVSGSLSEHAGGPPQREEDAAVLPRVPAHRPPAGLLGHWPAQNQDGHFPTQVKISSCTGLQMLFQESDF